jgi:hypothetical protein
LIRYRPPEYLAGTLGDGTSLLLRPIYFTDIAREREEDIVILEGESFLIIRFFEDEVVV